LFSAGFAVLASSFSGWVGAPRFGISIISGHKIRLAGEIGKRSAGLVGKKAATGCPAAAFYKL
jgi:hypothetical protein